MGILIKDEELLSRFVYFKEALDKLSKFPLSYTPTIDELEVNKSMVQTAYRDMKKYGLKNTSVIDYLCWVSSNKVLIDWIMAINQTIKLYQYEILEDKNKETSNIIKIIQERALILIDTCLKNPIDTKNFLRLFSKDISFLINQIDAALFPIDQKKLKSQITSKNKIFYQYWIFKIIGALRFIMIQSEKSKKSGEPDVDTIKKIISDACIVPALILNS